MNATQFAFKASTTEAKAPRARRAAPKVEDRTVFADLPSSRRVMVATITGLITYAGSAYWTMSCVELVSFAALTFSGSAFLSFMVWVLGLCIAIFASARLGYTVFKAIMDYEPGSFAAVGSSIKNSASRKVSLVRGWFVRGDVVTQ